MNFIPDFDELINHIRRICTEVIGDRKTKTTLSCTAYDPVAHAVKGIIQPHGIESGWVALGALHTGNGFGILVGPNVGDANGVGGDQFDLDHENGDPNTLVARHKQFSSTDKPPVVQAGEMCVKHASGTMDYYFKDGTRQMTHATGATETWDVEGNLTTNALAQNILSQAAGMKDTTAKKIVTGVVHLATG